MSEDSHGNGRLDSWKEIAAYLNRDIRTVIRWEHKGLPVHRVPGGKRHAIFAYRHEIDAWLDGDRVNGSNGFHSVKTEAVEANSPKSGVNEDSIHNEDSTRNDPLRTSSAELQDHGTITSFPVPSAAKSHPELNWKAGAAICLLALVAIAGIFIRSRTSADVHAFSLRQITDDGRAKAYARTDGKTVYFSESEGARYVLASTPVAGGPIHVINTPFGNVALQDVSSDGKTLLVTPYEGILIEGPLWTVPTQGGTPRRLGEAVCSHARWSQDGSKIACSYRTTVSILEGDGSNMHMVVTLGFPIVQVEWNPDGKHLRYVAEDTVAHTFSQWELEIDAEGNSSQPRKLEFGPHCCYEWTWTHDGKTLVYTEFVINGKAHLMMQPSDSERTIELPVNIGSLFGVVSGPKSNALYLDIADPYRGELLKFDSKQQAFQTLLPGISAAFVAFSPDGKWITYTNTQDSSLWRSRADGSEPLQLAKPPMQVQVSSWSPDGRTIAFMGQAPGKPWRIFLIDRDGGPAREAADGTDNQGGPSWSPDGKTIVYGNVFCENTQNCWIRRLDLATRRADILPGSEGLRTARWSPDGKYIAALRFQTGELMLFDRKTEHWRVLADAVSGDNINWSSDSQWVFVDSPRENRPVIEKINIARGERETVVRLASLQTVPGTIANWVGLAPDNSPLLCHMFNSSEIYELHLAAR